MTSVNLQLTKIPINPPINDILLRLTKTLQYHFQKLYQAEPGLEEEQLRSLEEAGVNKVSVCLFNSQHKVGASIVDQVHLIAH